MVRRILALAGGGLLGLVGAHALRQSRAIAAVDPAFRRNPYLWIPDELFRTWLLPVIRAFPYPSSPLPDGVVEREATVPGPAGDVPVLVLEPEGNGDGSRPGVLFVHGGGMIIGSARDEVGEAGRLARELGAVVVSPDYRLAPEHPFPAAPEDCFAAWTWLHERAAELGVDPTRTAVVGGSAGGGLAAMVTHLVRDRGAPQPRVQVLLYPMLDDRTTLRRDHRGTGRLVWTPRANRIGWTSFLGSAPRHEEAPAGAVPARRADLSGLPPAWIGVGELDLFRDEDVEYAHRLRAAGVDVELVEVPRAHHAFELDPPSEAGRAFVASYTGALRRALFPGADRGPDAAAR